MAETLYLGVDGGGTRCRARLETADGRVLGQGVSGPASMRFGIQAASASILSQVDIRQPEGSEMDGKALKTELARLRELLATDDLDASDVHDSLRRALEIHYPKEARALGQAINEFAFPQAVALLDGMLDRETAATGNGG
mgnify:CR=1 FL=1